METLPRITRRMAHKLLQEKSLPNRLQRFCNGGFKRKAEFLTLDQNKRRREIYRIQNVRVCTALKDKGISPPIAEDNLQPNDVNPLLPYSDRNDEAQIVVELSVPLPQALSPNTLKSIADFESEEDSGDYEVPAIDGDRNVLMEPGNALAHENVLSEFQSFNLSLALDTDSEDQTLWTLNLVNNDLSEVEGVVEKFHEEVVTSKPSKPLDNQTGVVKVCEKMLETDMSDVHSNPFQRAVKEENEEASCLELESNMVFFEKQSTCRVEQLKGLSRRGPGSKWLYSGSRFAAFLRSAVGLIAVDAEEHLSHSNGKATAVEGRHAYATPPKQHSAKFPGKRKISLSPSSQLKLLEASKSSSYRRMLPFCNELAKDLAKASATQSTTKMLPREDCIGSKECDMYTDKVLIGGTLSPEHAKSEENESDSVFVTYNQGQSCKPTLRTQVEPEQNGSLKELPPVDEEKGRRLSTGYVKVEVNKAKMKLAPSDEEMSTEPPCTEHAKFEENVNKREQACSDEGMEIEPSCTGHSKHEQYGGQMELPTTDEEMRRDPACIGHANFEQNESQMELICSNEEFSREPVATKHAKLKENVSELQASIGDGLSNVGLSVGHRLEESGSQLEPGPGDEYLSRKSLFVEHAEPEQNGSHPELANCDHISRRQYLFTKCVKSKQTECQFKYASIQSQPSPACCPYDPSDNIEKYVASQSSTKLPSLLFSNRQRVSTIPMQKSPTLGADSTSLVDCKTSLQSLSSFVDCTFFPTHGEVTSPIHTPASVPSKGILKVSPPSCKGVCMCSDCASFRFQVERASDFSERQLREAEALAVALMNELANARNVVEKYLISRSKGAQISYPVPHSELKEACKRAVRVEETARSQLVQMTRACNLHCKILRMQQRRVKFADKVEVKMFKS